MSIARFRRLAWSAAAGLAAAGALLATMVVTPNQSARAEDVGVDQAPYLAEDFTYPGADQILQSRNIKLLKGDGHILLTDCGTTSQQIKIWRRTGGDFCFNVTGASGYLTLDVTGVWAVETLDHPVSASLTAQGATQDVTVAKGGFQPVGEGVPGGSVSVLVELRVTG
ncbi:hypothetical protein EDD38_7251 [Kitasatospora cineracea]|uniref:Secreted protein n=1 Tax=Kitasatospora cineracea TaxID=88074 RepID=A0A3N4RV56_9ACTN|nr:hypothetical protein EDD38_7251 [Kitasatospora cineracea]